MVLTAKIKLLRTLSVIQCWIALWLIVLGIVERARVTWRLTGLGIPIWTGIWVAITGSVGVFISFKQLQQSSNIVTIPQHLVMTLMGFSLTCGVLSSIILIHYGPELATSANQAFVYYTLTDRSTATVEKVPISFDARYSEEHALVGSIFAFTLVELIVAMWSAALCFVSDQKASVTNEPYEIDPLMGSSGQGPEASGAAILNV